MIILDSTVKSLEIKLGGAVATSEIPWVISWADITTTTFVPGSGDGVRGGGGG